MDDRIADLFARHGPLVYRRALQLMGSAADAEEATQEVFIRAAAAIDGFQRISPPAMIAMTVVMAVSQLSDFWLPLLGVQTGGLSCASSLGALVGGLAGTFLIPIPLLGTLIGTVAGALLIEFARRGQATPAITAGKQAARLFVIGYALRLVSSVIIVIIYIASLASVSF